MKDVQSIVVTFRISAWWSNTNFCEMSNKFWSSSMFVFLYTSKISTEFGPRWMAAVIVVDIINPPHHYVGLQSFNTNHWCPFRGIQLFPQVLEVFSRYWCSEICILWNSIFDLPQFPGAGRLSVILLPLLRIQCWVVVGVSGQFPAAGWNTTLIQLLIPRAVRNHSNLAEDFFFALWRFLDTKFIGLGCVVWTKVAARKDRGIRDNSTNEGAGPTHHVWSFHRSTCLRVGFWCQHIWFGSWTPNWFFRITYQEQLCGFLTRVSSLDFCPQWSIWSLLHCLQRSTTETHLEKILRLYSRDPPLNHEQVIPSIRNPASNEMISGSCKTVGYWRLFLAHRTDRNDCWYMRFRRGWFWVLQVACNILVLE